MPDHNHKRRKALAVTIGTNRGANVKVLKAKKKLIELGADPRLVRRAQPYWLGHEKQAIKTFEKVKRAG